MDQRMAPLRGLLDHLQRADYILLHQACSGPVAFDARGQASCRTSAGRTSQVAGARHVHGPVPLLRQPRHRNRALASYRRSKAVELGAGGRSYQQIADELGYANRGTVHRLVREALEAQQVQSVELLREVEVRRLDALQVGLWGSAMAGDTEAAQRLPENHPGADQGAGPCRAE